MYEANFEWRGVQVAVRHQSVASVRRLMGLAEGSPEYLDALSRMAESMAPDYPFDWETISVLELDLFVAGAIKALQDASPFAGP